MGFERSFYRAFSCHQDRTRKRTSLESTLKSIACVLACVVFTALTAQAQGVGYVGRDHWNRDRLCRRCCAQLHRQCGRYANRSEAHSCRRMARASSE